MIQLEVQDVHKSFGGMHALNGVTFSVRGNELIGLIGPNGAGKTTLTNVLDGIHKPSRGQVWFGGQRIDGLPPYEIARRGVGRTFQVTRLSTHDRAGEYAECQPWPCTPRRASAIFTRGRWRC
jgi:branched-chain amino acid transport system ATP-binding protein